MLGGCDRLETAPALPPAASFFVAVCIRRAVAVVAFRSAAAGLAAAVSVVEAATAA